MKNLLLNESHLKTYANTVYRNLSEECLLI